MVDENLFRVEVADREAAEALAYGFVKATRGMLKTEYESDPNGNKGIVIKRGEVIIAVFVWSEVGAEHDDA